MCPACMTTIALTAGAATTAGGVLTHIFRNPIARTYRRIVSRVAGAMRESSLKSHSENRP
jgi:hypothetical protein